MKRFVTKLLVAMLTVVTVINFMPAKAVNYTPLNGSEIGNNGQIVINKYLVITGDVEVPNSLFTYTLSYPEALNALTNLYVEATDETVALYTTVNSANKVRLSSTTATQPVNNRTSLRFTSADATMTGPVSDSVGSAEDIVVRDDQKYVQKEVILDFTGVLFTEPGVYRFWLQEAGTVGNSSAIVNDAQTEADSDAVKTWRTIDIYIEHDLTKNEKALTVKGYVIYEGKLEKNDLPKSDITFDFDPTKNEAGYTKSIAENTWTLTTTETSGDPAVTTTTVVTYSWNAADKKWDTSTVVDGGTPVTGTADKVDDKAVNADGEKYGDVYAAEFGAQRDIAALLTPENTAEAGEKNGVYVNEYEAHRLEIKKTVTGNQGSRDKYFKFTVELDCGDAAKDQMLILDKSNMDTSISSRNNATNAEYSTTVINAANGRDDDTTTSGVYEIKLLDGGKVTFDVYLQHGQSVAVKALPKGAKYKITEAEADKEGYETTVRTLDGNLEVSGSDVASGESGKTYFVNNTSGVYYLLKDGTLTPEKPRLTSDYSSLDTKYLRSGTPGNYTYTPDASGTFYALTNGEYTEAEPNEDQYADLDNRYTLENHIEYINNREGIIPTGVMAAASTGAAIVAIGAAGFFFISRRKEDDEDEE